MVSVLEVYNRHYLQLACYDPARGSQNFANGYHGKQSESLWFIFNL